MPAKEPNVKVRPSEIPVLPLRDVVVFPGMVIPLFIGRPKSIRALELAIKDDRRIILVAQQNSSLDEPKEEDLYQIGTLASLLQLLKLPDGTVKILVEGEERVQIKKFIDSDKCLLTNFELLKIEKTDHLKLEAFVRSAISLFGEYVKLNAKIPAEIITLLSSITDENRLSDTIAAHLNLKLHDKQLLLESCDLLERFQRLVSHLEHEINILQLEKRISSRVKDQVKKSQ